MGGGGAPPPPTEERVLVVSAAMLGVLYTAPVHGRPPGAVWLHCVLETLRSLVVAAAEGERIRAPPPPPCPALPRRAGSALAATGRQAVVQRVAEGLGRLQDLRPTRGEGFLRALPEQFQPRLPAHFRHAGAASLPPAAEPRRGRDGQAARVHHPAGGRTARLQALGGRTEGEGGSRDLGYATAALETR